MGGRRHARHAGLLAPHAQHGQRLCGQCQQTLHTSHGHPLPHVQLAAQRRRLAGRIRAAVRRSANVYDLPPGTEMGGELPRQHRLESLQLSPDRATNTLRYDRGAARLPRLLRRPRARPLRYLLRCPDAQAYAQRQVGSRSASLRLPLQRGGELRHRGRLSPRQSGGGIGRRSLVAFAGVVSRTRPQPPSGHCGARRRLWPLAVVVVSYTQVGRRPPVGAFRGSHQRMGEPRLVGLLAAADGPRGERHRESLFQQQPQQHAWLGLCTRRDQVSHPARTLHRHCRSARDLLELQSRTAHQPSRLRRLHPHSQPRHHATPGHRTLFAVALL